MIDRFLSKMGKKACYMMPDLRLINSSVASRSLSIESELANLRIAIRASCSSCMKKPFCKRPRFNHCKLLTLISRSSRTRLRRLSKTYYPEVVGMTNWFRVASSKVNRRAINLRST